MDHLLAVVQAVAAGEDRMPPLDREAVSAASSRLAAQDVSVAGMLFAKVTVDEIAQTLGLSIDEVRARALRIIGRLQARERRGAVNRLADPEPAVG